LKLSVPNAEKDMATKLGAEWNSFDKTFEVREALPIHRFDRWIPLTIELVPSNTWYTNVRSLVNKKDWDFLRKTTYSIAKYRCEICGAKGMQQGVNHPVEAHEIWQYDDEAHIQKLIGIQALCPMCHKCKHIGLASVKGYLDECVEHICNVNNWDEATADQYIEESMIIWQLRGKKNWRVDISLLFEEYAIKTN
jgi:hypothetical protein